MLVSIKRSKLRGYLKKPAFYILAESLDDEGNRVVSYMNSAGVFFSSMDSDGYRPDRGGQYFSTYEEAESVMELHEKKLQTGAQKKT